jgi:hypothetical protein
MSDGSGKNPMASVAGSLWGSIVLGLTTLLALAMVFGMTTGLKPKKGDLTSVTDLGSFFGALVNFTFRSGTDTFLPDATKNMDRIEGSVDQPRLMQPSQRLVPDAVPTSAKAKSNQTNNAAAIADQTEVYDVDLNGNPIAPLTPIKK